MAVRTTASAVQKVIDVDTDIWDDQFIDDASVIVDKVESNSGSAYSAAELEFMERYIAAHLYAIRDPQYVKEKTGRSSATYQRGSTTGVGLDSTQWGQTALSFDHNGDLGTISGSESGAGGTKVQIAWGGTE